MISPMTLSALAEITDGLHSGADVTFCAVSTDSRNIQKGDLFIALKGPNFDGNQYVETAKEKNAVAALVEGYQSIEIPQVKVANTLAALGLIAGHNRDLYTGSVIAVTGSSGKTSVKEMLSTILSGEGKTLSTFGNLNNNIGAPLTLIRIDAHHQFSVIELGASAVGEIAYTAALTKPDVSIITNAGNAHLEGFGSYDNIGSAEGEIISALSDEGTAVLNLDDPAFENWQTLAQSRKVVSFSLDKEKNADVWAESVILDSNSSAFTLCWKGGQVALRLPLPGKHNIANALAASCAASAIGVSWTRIQAGLSQLRSVKGRLDITKCESGYTIIDDTYNANPSSTHAALDVLGQYKGFRVAVLGDMAELGSDAHALHKKIGEYAREGRADALYVCGKFADSVAKGYGKGAFSFETKASLIDSLKNEVQEGATYLIKGSRGSAMEVIVEEMLKQKVIS